MKKVLLCTLLAGLAIAAMAQEKRSVDVGLWASAGVSQSYDRQTQFSVYPMTQMHDDGFIACTWTNEDNSTFPGSSTPYRGVGYSYSTDGGQTWSAQENRVGGIPVYWPSYAQWGANGEAILARNADAYVYNGVQVIDGLVLMTRPNKGQGAWTITPVPYPAGASPNAGYTMAWARMTTSGDNHQYIHIMSPMSTPTTQPYQGYVNPIFYYRTQDGGLTWDINGKLVPEMLGEEWHEKESYNDAISFAVQGNIVACSFIRWGSLDHYVLKSLDNGDTWNSISFFHSKVGYYGSPSISDDIVYVPAQGCIALDNNGKIHVAFSVKASTNNEQEGYISFFYGWSTSFLTYWNENMEPIDGDNDFVDYKIETSLDNYFDWDQSIDEQLYVKSTIPQWPLIGYFIPVLDQHYYTMLEDNFEWAGKSYGHAGLFSFPQMTFDASNTLHLTYLGLLDGGSDGDNWLRHPFYTTTSDGGQTWTQTEYLVNNLGLINREFAYLTLAGVSADNKMYLMAQVDPYAGVYTAYSGQDPDHYNPTSNYFTFFTVEGVVPPPPPPPCDPVADAIANIAPDCKSATITWTAVDEAKEYEIRRDGVLLDKITATSYTETFDFVNDTTYVWGIKTICEENVYVSMAVSVSATADCEVCDPVTNTSAAIQDCETATITWETVTGAKEYKIARDGVETVVAAPPYTEDFEFESGQSYTWTIVTVCQYTESDTISVSATADCTGISELAGSVFIYPNPSNTSVTVNAKGFAKVEVYNTVGQLVETTTANIVDVSAYNAGIYFFKVYDVNNNSVTKRVMVTK